MIKLKLNKAKLDFGLELDWKVAVQSFHNGKSSWYVEKNEMA